MRLTKRDSHHAQRIQEEVEVLLVYTFRRSSDPYWKLEALFKIRVSKDNTSARFNERNIFPF